MPPPRVTDATKKQRGTFRPSRAHNNPTTTKAYTEPVNVPRPKRKLSEAQRRTPPMLPKPQHFTCPNCGVTLALPAED